MTESGVRSPSPLDGPRSDEAAAWSRERLAAAIVDGAPDGIVVTDGEGRIAEFNPAAERTLGFRRAEVVGRYVTDVLLPPARRNPYADGSGRPFTTDHAMVLGRPVELSTTHADGHEIVVELTLGRTTVDGHTCLVLQLRDVTERTRFRVAADRARHTREAALRADVIDVLTRSANMRAMLQGCAEALVHHLGAAFARIWTLPRGGTVLELRASAGDYTRLDGAYARIPVGERKVGHIARAPRSSRTTCAPTPASRTPRGPGARAWSRSRAIRWWWRSAWSA